MLKKSRQREKHTHSKKYQECSKGKKLSRMQQGQKTIKNAARAKNYQECSKGKKLSRMQQGQKNIKNAARAKKYQECSKGKKGVFF